MASQKYFCTQSTQLNRQIISFLLTITSLMFWLFTNAILRQNHYENIKVTLCHTSIQYGSECQYNTELAPP